MKKKLFVTILVVMCLIGVLGVCEVFAVDPSAFSGTDADITSKSDSLKETIIYISGSITIVCMILSFFYRIMLVIVDKENIEKREKIKYKADILYVIGFFAMIFCWFAMNAGAHHSYIIHN